MRLRNLPIALGASFLVPAVAAASDKDQEKFDAMNACFASKAAELNDHDTPLDDLADVIIGMCWIDVNEHRRRWTNDWGTAWSGFVGPYFVLQVKAKAKEAIYSFRNG